MQRIFERGAVGKFLWNIFIHHWQQIPRPGGSYDARVCGQGVRHQPVRRAYGSVTWLVLVAGAKPLVCRMESRC